MANTYFAVVTDLGTRKMLEAINEEKKVDITSIAVGDGDGGYYTPTTDMAQLKNEVWRGAVTSCKISEESENLLIIESVIPSDVGGFTIREMGAFDSEGELIAICNTPDTQKVRVSDGVVHELSLSMEVVLSNTDSVQLVVDPNVVTATKKDLENLREELQEGLNDIRSKTLEPSINKTIVLSEDEDKITTTYADGSKIIAVLSEDENSIVQSEYDSDGILTARTGIYMSDDGNKIEVKELNLEDEEQSRSIDAMD